MGKGHEAVNVAYVTCNEALWAPLLQRQVLELIVDSATRMPVGTLYLVSFISGVDYFRNHQRIKNLRAQLRSSNIKPIILPALTPFPLPYFLPVFRRGRGWTRMHNMTAWTVPFVLLHSLPILLLMHLLLGVRVFHCRSYAASLAALVGKQLFRDLRFIFDPRSDYPEENVTAGTWSSGSLSFRVWKWLEKKFVEHADYVVCITEPYRRHFGRISAGRFVVIPNNVDTQRFVIGSETFRNEFREGNNLKGRLVFCYLGSIAAKSWHNPDIYVKAIKAFRALERPHSFLFLIPGDSRHALVESLAAGGITPDEYVVSHPGFEEVPSYLAVADYGVMFLDTHKICLGTKVAEYMAAGLPVLVNANVAGACPLIEAHGLGAVVDIAAGGSDGAVSTEKIRSLADTTYDSRKICQFARDNFSNDVAARAYTKLYRDLGMEKRGAGASRP